jgi:2-hydroxychromene-2-carboxylate isomerase
MDPKVEFHHDFGSPNAYLCHRVIPAIEARTGVRFQYVPILLGGIFKLTGNASPAVTLQGIRNKGEYQSLEMRRFLAEHGIEDFRFNPHFPVNTLQLMRGAIVARRHGFHQAYVDAVYRCMWSDPRKMDDPDVIRGVLEEVGLDARTVLEEIADPGVKAELVANTEDSVARGSFGSPSFFVGGELYFGKDRLEQVEREIVRQRDSL